ncbi:MAG: preprotein translocase subunit YajC [Prevotella sp.]|nr:preprotein translocase subunit YajC [Prevotella sp.]
MTQILLDVNILQVLFGNPISLLIIMFAIMWFFMFLPQQRQKKEIAKFQNSLTEGTQVVTGGGIHGTVKRIDLAAGIVELEIARGVVIRVDKNYVFKDFASIPMQR